MFSQGASGVAVELFFPPLPENSHDVGPMRRSKFGEWGWGREGEEEYWLPCAPPPQESTTNHTRTGKKNSENVGFIVMFSLWCNRTLTFQIFFCCIFFPLQLFGRQALRIRECSSARQWIAWGAWGDGGLGAWRKVQCLASR